MCHNCGVSTTFYNFLKQVDDTLLKEYQLEITADNVKCAHGATVSQLEDDQIFYLQSRGIDENDARKLLVNAFATEIINFIPVPSLCESLLKTVTSLTNK